MTRVPELSQRRIVRALQRAGFRVVRQGKHIAMYSEERNVMAIVPRHSPVKRSTLAELLKQVEMTPQEFQTFL